MFVVNGALVEYIRTIYVEMVFVYSYKFTFLEIIAILIKMNKV